MPTVSDSQKRLALAAAHTPGGFGGMSHAAGLELMHADQKVGRVGRGFGGSLSMTLHPVHDFVRSGELRAADTAGLHINPVRGHFADGGSSGSQSFDTPLSPSERAAFQVWKQKYAPNDTGVDYDLAGAFKAGLTPDPQRGHFPDTFKKPNHPTFSNESQYSTPEHQGGSWTTLGNHDVFVPSQYNLTNTSPQQLRQYFNADEPSAMINFPEEENGYRAGGSVQKATHIATHMARGKLADGGTYMPPHPAFGEMQDYRSIMSPTAGGIIASEVPGRTDHIPTSVAADSYVIPADVVSGLGEGNTLAGARAVQEWLGSGPYGTPLPRGGGHGSSIPHPPAASEGGGRTTTTYTPHLAHGGSAGRAPLKSAHIKNVPGEVPVIVAGGEMLIDPHVIAHHPDLGGLSPHDKNPEHYRRAVSFGHKVLDKFVVNERKKTIKTLSSLPGPSK